MKKLIFIFLIFLISSATVKAQHAEVLNMINKLLRENQTYSLDKDFWDKGMVFTISIDVDEKGQVDSVFISNRKNKKGLDFDKIVSALKTNNKDFMAFKNDIVVLLVFIYKGDEYNMAIKNGNDFLADFLAISENSTKIRRIKSGKRQVFLSPLVIYSFAQAIKN